MALTDKELQELAELEELETLEAKFGSTQTVPEEAPISAIKSAAIGAGQGVTFDWGDELLAALRATSSDKSYEELQKEYETVARQAAEENPISYYAGNIGTGIAFNPMGKAIAAGLKSANTAATAASPFLQKLAQQAPAISKVGQMATEGAIAGATIGAGQASADESMTDAALSGAKTGFTLGGIIGAGGEVINKLLPSATKIVKEADLPKTLEKIKRVKEAGYDVGSEATIAQLDKELEDAVKAFAIGSREQGSFALPDIRLQLGKQIGDLREEAVSLFPDFKVQITADDLDDLVNIPGPHGPVNISSQPQLAKIVRSLGLEENGALVSRDFTAQEASDMAKQLGDILANKVSGLKIKDPSVREAVAELQEKLIGPIDQQIISSGKLPGYEAAKRAFGTIADTQKRLNLHDFYRGDAGLIEQDTKHMLSKIKQLENTRSLTGTAFERETRLVRNLVDSPDFKLLPQNAQDSIKKSVEILDNLENQVSAKNLTLDATGRTTADSKGVMFLLNSYRSLLTKGVNAALEAKDSIGSVSNDLITPTGTQTIGKIGTGIKNSVDVDVWFDRLGELAKKHNNKGLADTIDYIAKQDMKKRRALTFVLMQQPGVRSLLNENKETEK